MHSTHGRIDNGLLFVMGLAERESNLVIYAQSTIAVISGRRERERERTNCLLMRVIEEVQYFFYIQPLDKQFKIQYKLKIRTS